MKPVNIAIFGASGAIGNALINELSRQYPQAQVHAFSRTGPMLIDYENEASIAAAAQQAAKDRPLDLVIVANGILHDGSVQPEKSLQAISANNFHYLFKINTILPALIAKHCLPRLNKDQTAYFAALSARVGSISENQLGGWYAYRASKAALNMFLKTASIEVARTNKKAVVVGLHPGTVDSNLSKPFQHYVPPDQLFTPEYAAQKILEVLSKLTPEQTGKVFAWDGQAIPA